MQATWTLEDLIAEEAKEKEASGRPAEEARTKPRRYKTTSGPTSAPVGEQRFDWIVVAESEDAAAGRRGGGTEKELVAFQGDDGSVGVLGAVDPGVLFEDCLVNVGPGGVAVAWKDMFDAVGVSAPELLALFAKRSFDSVPSAQLRASYKLLSGAAVTEPELAAFSKSELLGLAKLALKAGAFIAEAEGGVSALVASRANSDDEKSRLRLAMCLSRRAGAGRRRSAWQFDEAEFSSAVEGLPGCYRSEALSAGRAIRSVCEQGKRPIVLVKAPDGAPIGSLARCLARAFGAKGGDTVEIGPISSALDVLGTNASYSGAIPGLLARGLCSCGDVPVVLAASAMAELKKGDGDPCEFVRRACGSGGLPIDAYMGVPMEVVSPIVITDTLGKSEFESTANVVLSLHQLSRDEKKCELSLALRSAGLRAGNAVLCYIVDHYCFDDGVAMMQDAVDSLAAEFAGRQKALTAKDVEAVLPKPDVRDVRYLVGQKRTLLDRADARWAETAERLAKSAMECESEESKDGILRKLEMLLGSVPNPSERLPAPSPGELERALSKTHPHLGGMEAVARELSAALASRSPEPVLLVGPAGTGKTTLAQSLSGALGGVPFVKRDFPGMSTTELYGTVATPSLLTEAISSFSSPGVLVLDEVDKPSALPSTALLSLLDLRKYVDSYLNLSVDVSSWLVVLTCNDESAVSDYVINRVRKVEVFGYTPQDKVEIAQSILVDRSAASLGRPATTFDRGALEHLAVIDDEAGLRGFERRIASLVAVSDGRTVSPEDAVAMFPMEKASGYGVRVVMPRGGSKGGAALACVFAVRDDSGKGMSVLSGATAFESCVRQVQVPLMACGAKSSAKVGLAECDDIENADCRLAQLGTAVALALAAEELPVDLPSVAFLGELHPSGKLKELSKKQSMKAPFMIARAKVHGVDAILCPASFAAEAESSARAYGIDLLPVDHLVQALDYAKDVQRLSPFLESLCR